jgi:tetratricopeptide (TPR) repeat protein
VSGSEDGTVRLWDGPERLVLRAIARIGRPAPILTSLERQRFGIGEEVALPGQALLKPLMVQAQALGLVEQGNALARTGAISEAVAHFETALALDPTLHLTPEPYARRVLSNTVQALLFAGRQAAQAGQLETALAKLTEAAALQPTLNQEALAAEFRQLAGVTPSPTVTGTATVVAPLSPLATPTPSVAVRSPLATPTPRATTVGP